MVVLVGYASAQGSTRGVAERIGARLAARGVAVQVRPVEAVTDVGGYDAVVLGSAIHGQAWLPVAAALVHAHLAELAARPVWLFSVGMPGALGRPLRKWAMQEGPKAVAPFAAVHARGDRLFSGVIRREQIPPFVRLVFRLMGGRYGDFRNWAEIDAWADGIAAALPVAAGPAAGTG